MVTIRLGEAKHPAGSLPGTQVTPLWIGEAGEREFAGQIFERPGVKFADFSEYQLTAIFPWPMEREELERAVFELSQRTGGGHG